MVQRRGRQSAEIAERTRRGILDAAGEQFASAGFKAASLREIAAAAGTTHGLIRHHFGSKEDLWRAVVDDFVNRVAARQQPLQERVEGAGDPVELLKAFATAYMRQAAETPEVARLLLSDCREPGPRLDYLLERTLPLHRSITPLFERVRATGRLGVHDPDSFFLFLVMLGAVPFALPVFANAFSGEDLRSDAGAEAHVQRVLATLFGESPGPG
jgi:AcrR family transcriptional regulator